MTTITAEDRHPLDTSFVQLLDPKLVTFLRAASEYTAGQHPESIRRASIMGSRAYLNDTCLIHESIAMRNEDVVAADQRCSICTGLIDAISYPAMPHAICIARQRREAPIPVVDSIRPCDCTPCRSVG